MKEFERKPLCVLGILRPMNMETNWMFPTDISWPTHHAIGEACSHLKLPGTDSLRLGGMQERKLENAFCASLLSNRPNFSIHYIPSGIPVLCWTHVQVYSTCLQKHPTHMLLYLLAPTSTWLSHYRCGTRVTRVLLMSDDHNCFHIITSHAVAVDQRKTCLSSLHHFWKTCFRWQKSTSLSWFLATHLQPGKEHCCLLRCPTPTLIWTNQNTNHGAKQNDQCALCPCYELTIGIQGKPVGTGANLQKAGKRPCEAFYHPKQMSHGMLQSSKCCVGTCVGSLLPSQATRHWFVAAQWHASDTPTFQCITYLQASLYCAELMPMRFHRNCKSHSFIICVWLGVQHLKLIWYWNAKPAKPASWRNSNGNRFVCWAFCAPWTWKQTECSTLTFLGQHIMLLATLAPISSYPALLGGMQERKLENAFCASLLSNRPNFSIHYIPSGIPVLCWTHVQVYSTCLQKHPTHMLLYLLAPTSTWLSHYRCGTRVTRVLLMSDDHNCFHIITSHVVVLIKEKQCLSSLHHFWKTCFRWRKSTSLSWFLATHLQPGKEHCCLLRCPTPSLDSDQPEYQPNQQPWCEAKRSMCIMLCYELTIRIEGNTWALGRTCRRPESDRFVGTCVGSLLPSQATRHWFVAAHWHASDTPTFQCITYLQASLYCAELMSKYIPDVFKNIQPICSFTCLPQHRLDFPITDVALEFFWWAMITIVFIS